MDNVLIGKAWESKGQWSAVLATVGGSHVGPTTTHPSEPAALHWLAEELTRSQLR